MSDNIPMQTDPNGVAHAAGYVKDMISGLQTARKERLARKEKESETMANRQDHFAAGSRHGGSGGMSEEAVLKALRMTLTHERKMKDQSHGHSKELMTHAADTVKGMGGVQTSMKVEGLSIDHTPTPATAKPAAAKKPAARKTAAKPTTVKPAVAKPAAVKPVTTKTTRIPKVK